MEGVSTGDVSTGINLDNDVDNGVAAGAHAAHDQGSQQQQEDDRFEDMRQDIQAAKVELKFRKRKLFSEVLEREIENIATDTKATAEGRRIERAKRALRVDPHLRSLVSELWAAAPKTRSLIPVVRPTQQSSGEAVQTVEEEIVGLEEQTFSQVNTRLAIISSAAVDLHKTTVFGKAAWEKLSSHPRPAPTAPTTPHARAGAANRAVVTENAFFSFVLDFVDKWAPNPAKEDYMLILQQVLFGLTVKVCIGAEEPHTSTAGHDSTSPQQKFSRKWKRDEEVRFDDFFYDEARVENMCGGMKNRSGHTVLGKLIISRKKLAKLAQRKGYALKDWGPSEVEKAITKLYQSNLLSHQKRGKQRKKASMVAELGTSNKAARFDLMVVRWFRRSYGAQAVVRLPEFVCAVQKFASKPVFFPRIALFAHLSGVPSNEVKAGMFFTVPTAAAVSPGGAAAGGAGQSSSTAATQEVTIQGDYFHPGMYEECMLPVLKKLFPNPRDLENSITLADTRGPGSIPAGSGTGTLKGRAGGAQTTPTSSSPARQQRPQQSPGASVPQAPTMAAMFRVKEGDVFRAGIPSSSRLYPIPRSLKQGCMKRASQSLALQYARNATKRISGGLAMDKALWALLPLWRLRMVQYNAIIRGGVAGMRTMLQRYRQRQLMRMSDGAMDAAHLTRLMSFSGLDANGQPPTSPDGKRGEGRSSVMSTLGYSSLVSNEENNQPGTPTARSPVSQQRQRRSARFVRLPSPGGGGGGAPFASPTTTLDSSDDPTCDPDASNGSTSDEDNDPLDDLGDNGDGVMDMHIMSAEILDLTADVDDTEGDDNDGVGDGEVTVLPGQEDAEDEAGAFETDSRGGSPQPKTPSSAKTQIRFAEPDTTISVLDEEKPTHGQFPSWDSRPIPVKLERVRSHLVAAGLGPATRQSRAVLGVIQRQRMRGADARGDQFLRDLRDGGQREDRDGQHRKQQRGTVAEKLEYARELQGAINRALAQA